MKQFLTISFLLLWLPVNSQSITVGAKHFNEGYILSEIIAQLLEQNGFSVDRKYNLGGTMVCFQALQQGEIDVYPEYSGTIAFEILKAGENLSMTKLNDELSSKWNLGLSEPYGFSNTYALVIKKSLGITINSISDLIHHPEIKIGLSYEFLKREDGWGKLSQVYGLNQEAIGLEHGLAYDALQQNSIDVTDAYSTDGEIMRYGLKVLEDDRQFFPDYFAASLYRKDLSADVQKVLEKLNGQISEQEIRAMNASVLYEKKTFEEVASTFLQRKGLANKSSTPSASIRIDLLKKTSTHLKLTFIAVFLAILIAVPLGIALYWHPQLATYVLYAVGLLQTIPSIALLAILIPLTGIGVTPAIIALFLYALLPIVRNTYTGLQTVDPVLKKVAIGMGMNKIQRMKWLELPLAIPFILTGIRTATVISIGTATLAAFIGAGGLGEYIVTGLALNNSSLILRGAIPAALLAIIIEIAFEILERTTRPKYLQKGND